MRLTPQDVLVVLVAFTLCHLPACLGKAGTECVAIFFEHKQVCPLLLFNIAANLLKIVLLLTEKCVISLSLSLH